MTPLTEDEKKDIARTFLELQHAIESGDDVDRAYAAFRQAYRGDSRAYVDQFDIATDKPRWAGQLRLYLEDEIGHDAVYWLPGYTPGGPDDEE